MYILTYTPFFVNLVALEFRYLFFALSLKTLFLTLDNYIYVGVSVHPFFIINLKNENTDYVCFEKKFLE